MEKKELKVGQSFEVVKVLDAGFSDKTLFKIGGFTLGETQTGNCIKCMGNGSKKITDPISNRFMSTCYLNMRIGSEVKPIGKLTITKLK